MMIRVGYLKLELQRVLTVTIIISTLLLYNKSEV